MPGSLTLQELKSELWNCAQILRGSAIDRTDWKGYILPLLFLKLAKRLSVMDAALPATGEREKRLRTLKTLICEPFGCEPQATPEG